MCPKEYIGKRVDLIYDTENVSIYHGLRLVTIHQRDDTPYASPRRRRMDCPVITAATRKTWRRFISVQVR